MAKPSVSRPRGVPKDGVVVDASLNHVSALDAINQATSVLEYLVGRMFEEADDTSEAFGQCLLYRQIAKQLRVAVDQLIDAPGTGREVGHA